MNDHSCRVLYSEVWTVKSCFLSTLNQGWGTFFLPRAIWIFITSVSGHSKWSNEKLARRHKAHFPFDVCIFQVLLHFLGLKDLLDPAYVDVTSTGVELDGLVKNLPQNSPGQLSVPRISRNQQFQKAAARGWRGCLGFCGVWVESSGWPYGRGVRPSLGCSGQEWRQELYQRSRPSGA